MATVTPTLHNGPVDVLTDRQKKLWNLLAFVFNNPGSISNTYEHELVSFRLLAAEYGSNKENLAAALEDSLQTVVQRIFNDEDIIVTVSYEDLNEGGDYDLHVGITSGGEVILTSPVRIINGEVSIENWSTLI